MGNWYWCQHCQEKRYFYHEDDHEVCSVCSRELNPLSPLPYVEDEKPEPCYEGNGIPSGFITFSQVSQKLGKSERTVRYDVATSNFPILTTSIKQDGRCLYREDLVDLTAKTGITVRYIDGALIIKASEAGRIMDISTKTAVSYINRGLVSGWCSGGHYSSDLQDVLHLASLRKPADSGRIRPDILRLFQEIRALTTSGHPSS